MTDNGDGDGDDDAIVVVDGFKRIRMFLTQVLWNERINGLVTWAYRTENRVFLVDTFSGKTMEKFYDIHNVFDASFLKHRHISNLVYKKPNTPHNIR